MATKVFDNFLDDKYLDELNDYNIWQLVAKQNFKWVDIHSEPTNVFERIIKKEYHKISPLYNTFKGYEYWRVTLNSFNNPTLSLHQDLDEILEEYECTSEDTGFIGDDLFDIGIMRKVEYSFCVLNSPKMVKDNANCLKYNGGDNVLMHLFELLEDTKLIPTVSYEDVVGKIYDLDIKEKF